MSQSLDSSLRSRSTISPTLTFSCISSNPPTRPLTLRKTRHIRPRPLFHDANVLTTKVYHAATLHAITSCTPNLLAVTFKSLWNRIMNNISDIGFVDPHAESYGGHNHYVL